MFAIGRVALTVAVAALALLTAGPASARVAKHKVVVKLAPTPEPGAVKFKVSGTLGNGSVVAVPVVEGSRFAYLVLRFKAGNLTLRTPVVKVLCICPEKTVYTVTAGTRRYKKARGRLRGTTSVYRLAGTLRY